MENTVKNILESLSTEEPFLSEDNHLGNILIYDSELNEEKIGDFPNDDSMSIHVQGGEGNIPHIHIMSRRQILLRVRLKESKYQRDSYEKNGNGQTLNTKQRKALNKYMHDFVPGSTITNWERMVLSWNSQSAGNPAAIINLKQVSCPDYTNIFEP